MEKLTFKVCMIIAPCIFGYPQVLMAGDKAVNIYKQGKQKYARE